MFNFYFLSAFSGGLVIGCEMMLEGSWTPKSVALFLMQEGRMGGFSKTASFSEPGIDKSGKGEIQEQRGQASFPGASQDDILSGDC